VSPYIYLHDGQYTNLHLWKPCGRLVFTLNLRIRKRYPAIYTCACKHCMQYIVFHLSRFENKVSTQLFMLHAITTFAWCCKIKTNKWV